MDPKHVQTPNSDDDDFDHEEWATAQTAALGAQLANCNKWGSRCAIAAAVAIFVALLLGTAMLLS